MAQPMNSLRKLAAAVLVHALVDAQKGCPEARGWLLEDDSAFPFWCCIYGIDPTFAREELGRAMKRARAINMTHEAITQTLTENPELSNREIGRRLGCNYETVRRVRKLVTQAVAVA